MRFVIGSAILIAALAAGCGKPAKAPEGILFKDDLAFLETHTKPVVLTGAGGKALVAVSPDIQGRVMTSTAGGPDGPSFGWINRELIASGENNPHINAFGGEDRFWLGPEGGQFSIFFKKGDPFDLDHWFTPPPINEGGYDVVGRGPDRIHFHKAMRLVNTSGTEFDLELNREIRLLEAADIAALGVPPVPPASSGSPSPPTTRSRTPARPPGPRRRGSSRSGSWACSTLAGNDRRHPLQGRPGERARTGRQ
jgi:hypothetical protein